MCDKDGMHGKTGPMMDSSAIFGAAARWGRVAAVAAVLCFGAAGARAERVAVADCERDSAVDVWAAPDVEFCRRVMDEVFALAGVEPVRAEFDADGMLVVSNAEVVCSAFRTPKLLEDYDFPQQPMGCT